LVNSDSDEDKMRAMIGFRKLTSLPEDAPIQAIIDSNLVPVFIHFLGRDDLTQMQFESVWALTNITSGMQEHVKLVVDKGVIPILQKMLTTPDVNLRNQVIWLIGNISGDDIKYRDLLLRDKTLLEKLVRA